MSSSSPPPSSEQQQLGGGDFGQTGPSLHEVAAYADDLTDLVLKSETQLGESDKENGAQVSGPALVDVNLSVESEPTREPERSEHEIVNIAEHDEPQIDAEQETQRLADDSSTKLHDITNSELLYQTFRTAVNTSRRDSQEAGEEEEAEEAVEAVEAEKVEIEAEAEAKPRAEKEDRGVLKEIQVNKNDNENKNRADKMEFTKNYSDDLLMGAGEQARAANESGGPDLADFELPPYNGSSSSGSEQATSTKQQHSPVKQRKSSNSATTQASSSSAASGLASSDLTAVKKILVSSYSKVAHVFHWKRPIESGIIFAIGLTLIAALTFFSIISVVAYSALGVVSASGLIRLYKTSMKALNRSAETPVDHIWEKALGLNVSMSPGRMHELIDSSHANLNASLTYFKQVLLVEDKMATFKFFLFLYSLTYIGAWFNGLTLITIIYVSIFSVPIIYEKNKTKIDEYLSLATSQISSAISMVTSKVTALAFGGQSGASSAKKQN